VKAFRSSRLLVSALAGVFLLPFLLPLLLLVGTAAAEEEQVTIALLPMVVHSGEDPGYLRNGLSDMFASRLEQVGRFRVIRVDEPSKATTRLERAVAIARKEKADFVLFGSFTRFGAGASLDIQCAATTQTEGEAPLREIFVHSGNIGDVIPDLDEVVGKVGRFALSDFRAEAPGSSDSTTPPAAGPDDSYQELELRVQALEEALEALSFPDIPPSEAEEPVP
jgi:TolB-like protein